MPTPSASFKIAAVQAAPVYLDRDSTIVGPDGNLIAGPVHEREDILYAEVDLRRLGSSKWMLDVAGHYARPDVFQLVVNREPRPMIASRDGASGTSEETKRKTPRRKQANR